MRTTLRSATLAAALCCLASVAHAHAPLPRGLAVSPDGPGIAVRMPGFGFLVRTAGTAPAFRYVCDALVGVRPDEERVAMAYRSDGALLLGTARGVFILGPNGCPTMTGPILGPAIEALAVRVGATDRAYVAILSTQPPASFATSDDGGETWDLLPSSLGPDRITALVIDDADPDRLLASQTGPMLETTLSVSTDGGETFESFAQDRALTLLRVQGNRLWATARIPNQGVGVSILRAAQPQGPWTEVLQVNFFGGFAVDPSDPDVIWIGDEARGVFRSTDGGDSFEETQPDVATACLRYGAGALWACIPGLPEQTALASSPDAFAAFEPAMAFSDVDELVDCAPSVDVEHVCQAAWIEWQRDVLGVMPTIPDAGAMPEPDAAIVDDGHAGSSGCSVTAGRTASSCAWLVVLGLIALRASRRRPHGLISLALPNGPLTSSAAPRLRSGNSRQRAAANCLTPASSARTRGRAGTHEHHDARFHRRQQQFRGRVRAAGAEQELAPHAFDRAQGRDLVGRAALHLQHGAGPRWLR